MEALAIIGVLAIIAVSISAIVLVSYLFISIQDKNEEQDDQLKSQDRTLTELYKRVNAIESKLP